MSREERDFEMEHAGKRRKMEDTGSVVCRDIDHGKCKLVEDSYVENDEDSVCGSELKGDGELVHRDGDSCVSENVRKDIIPCGSKSDGSISGDGDHRVTFVDAARDSTVEVKSVSEGLGNGGQVDGDDVSRERNSSSADQSSCIVSEQTHLDSPTNDSADQISERKKRETITKDENNAQAKFVETNKDGREEKPHLCKGIDVRKKLLVLDINGLLADVVSASSVSDDYKADIVIGMKAVFKRPHCDDFLQFCFERFNVGIWSSRTKKNIDPILELLLGGHRSKLVFCWDQSHCTPTGFNTIDNQRKPLVLKELKKLWGKDYPSLPWNIGDYDESNTLLLDDSPYKGLRNPPNTAIFPNTYEYKNLNDDSLGPKGDLRAYLEGLSLAPNVQEYVEHNLYGQQPISRSNPSWPFYAKVMGIDYTKQKEPSCQNASKGINIRLEEEAYRGTRGDNARTEYSERNTRSTEKDSVQLSSKTNQLWICRAGRTKEARYPRIQHTQFGMNRASFRKTKLLILDVNGLLADFVSYEPHGFKAHCMLGDKAVFKRPYCDDFLHFCFEKFHIGFWMTTSRRNAESNLDLLLGQELKQNVLFSWDISHCWGTNFCTLERTQPRDRHIYFKELHKVWETDEQNLLRWKYEFNQSNTLLVDNFPHSALLNPPHTAIFPPRYRFKDESTDNTLGPEGDLRVFLEEIAVAENVQEYVKNKPYGQSPISDEHPSWNYYVRVINDTRARQKRCLGRWGTPTNLQKNEQQQDCRAGVTVVPAPWIPHSSFGNSREVSCKKKLLILDVNGLLAEFVSNYDTNKYREDSFIGDRAVFKRPYCDDFLNFCFDKFHIGFWLTTTRRNTLCNLNFFLGSATKDVLFSWDLSHCLEPGHKMLERRDRPILFKELKKVWENDRQWRFKFDPSNTLLVDNYPSTALLNPPHTAIFPPRYSYKDEKTDDSLGPGGDLRVFLEGLVLAHNVQDYVKHNPFGQTPISDNIPAWNYYSKVIEDVKAREKDWSEWARRNDHNRTC